MSVYKVCIPLILASIIAFPIYAAPTLTLTYASDSAKPVPGVKITLTESDGTITILSTDTNGQVTLPTTSNTYTLSASLAETGNDPVDLLDAIMILQHSGELRTLTAEKGQLQAADVNADGEVDLLDAIWILQHSGELRTLNPSLVFLDAATSNPLSETTFSPTDTPSITVFRTGDVDQSFNPVNFIIGKQESVYITDRLRFQPDEIIIGTALDDYIESYNGNDRIDGRDGNDTFFTSYEYENPSDTIDPITDIDIVTVSGITKLYMVDEKGQSGVGVNPSHGIDTVTLKDVEKIRFSDYRKKEIQLDTNMPSGNLIFGQTFWYNDWVWRLYGSPSYFYYYHDTDRMVYTTANSEIILGTSENDFIDSNGGHDAIDGGGGHDTLLIFCEYAPERVQDEDPDTLSLNERNFNIVSVAGITKIYGHLRANKYLENNGYWNGTERIYDPDDVVDNSLAARYGGYYDGGDGLHYLVYTIRMFNVEAIAFPDQTITIETSPSVLNAETFGTVIWGTNVGTGVHGFSEHLIGTQLDDLIDANGGDDIIDGGKGNDTLVLFRELVDEYENKWYKIETVAGITKVKGTQNSTDYGTDSNINIISMINVETIAFPDQNITLTQPLHIDNVIWGSTAPETIVGTGGDDYIDSAGGWDFIDGKNGNDYLVVFGDRNNFEIVTAGAITKVLGYYKADSVYSNRTITLTNVENIVFQCQGCQYSPDYGDGSLNYFQSVDSTPPEGNIIYGDVVASQSSAVIGTNWDDLIDSNGMKGLIDGKGGTDTLVLFGNREDFTFVHNSTFCCYDYGDGFGPISVNGIGIIANGGLYKWTTEMVVANVEYIQFADQIVSVSELTN